MVSPCKTTWLMRGPVSKRWMVMLFSKYVPALLSALTTHPPPRSISSEPHQRCPGAGGCLAQENSAIGPARTFAADESVVLDCFVAEPVIGPAFARPVGPSQ